MDIEHSLIGSLLHDQKKMVEVLDIVSADHFSDQSAKRCFLKMNSLFRQGKPIDAALVVGNEIDLASYVADVSSTSGPFPVDYAHEVRTAAKDRRIRAGLSEILRGRRTPSENLDLLHGLYQQEMEVGKKSPHINKVMERFNSTVASNRRKGCLGIQTGFPFLQQAYIEYAPGDIWLVGGFTSVGKTAVMTQKVCNLVNREDSPSILIVSTEMTEVQIVTRILANFARVHSHKILTGNLYAGEDEQVSYWSELLSARNLMIYDDIRTLGEIETAARKVELQGGVDIIFVDYVQNLVMPGATSQYHEQSTLARGLQALAKDVSATVICLSQVSNDVGRGNTKQLEFKGAGEWAAVSDISVMLERHPQDEYLLAYRVKKNRHGAKPERKLEFKSDFTRLEDAGELKR